MYYNEELVTNSKFQTQLSRKLQGFRTCRKNKKCTIFHDLSEYIIFSYDCKLLDWSFKSCEQNRSRISYSQRYLINFIYINFIVSTFHVNFMNVARWPAANHYSPQWTTYKNYLSRNEINISGFYSSSLSIKLRRFSSFEHL